MVKWRRLNELKTAQQFGWKHRYFGRHDTAEEVMKYKVSLGEAQGEVIVSVHIYVDGDLRFQSTMRPEHSTWAGSRRLLDRLIASEGLHVDLTTPLQKVKEAVVDQQRPFYVL
jgi:hypothetical protein